MSYIAEQNVIGSLLMNPVCINEIYNLLEPEMFETELYGRIYLEFLRGFEKNYAVNPVVLERKMCNDKLPSYLLLEELKVCNQNTITSVNVKSYAEGIVAAYQARRANQILGSYRITADNVNSSLRQMINDLEAVIENKNNPSKTLPQIVEECEGMYFKERTVQSINLGFDKLDDRLGGLEGGDLIIIGARPGVGKSALVTQITSNLAKMGKRIGFFNLEMQNKQVYERFVASESGIGLTRLRRAVSFLGDEKERFKEANNRLKKADNIIISTGTKKVSDIRAESRHMGYDLIIVDYLQLLRPDKTYGANRYAEVGAISKALKGLAMELNIPVIALSQLNRSSEGRDDKEPTMSELREAGDIEQDASVILLLWNLSKDNPNKKGLKTEKNRQGLTGKDVYEFDGDHMRFKEVDFEYNVKQDVFVEKPPWMEVK